MYITFKVNKIQPQFSFTDLFTNFNKIINTPCDFNRKFLETFTKKITLEEAEQLKDKYNFMPKRNALHTVHGKTISLLQEDMSTQYHSFHIPKHSGGLRKIDAPNPELMGALGSIKNIFDYTLQMLPHNSAYAYVRTRSTLHTLQKHQQNISRWFLKIDIKNFFNNCNEEFIHKQLSQLFPLAFLYGTKDEATLRDLIKLGLLNDGLPQGTPLSPLLTNLIMLPIDYEIYNTFKNFDQRHFVYTRYADDILLSCRYHFNWRAIEKELTNIFDTHEAPFKINSAKTRYGSSAGRNWNLGLMLNKDNNITIGHKQKQIFKAMIFQLFHDTEKWELHDLQVILGKKAYYEKIEPEWINNTIQKYETKFNKSFKELTQVSISKLHM